MIIVQYAALLGRLLNNANNEPEVTKLLVCLSMNGMPSALSIQVLNLKLS